MATAMIVSALALVASLGGSASAVPVPAADRSRAVTGPAVAPALPSVAAASQDKPCVVSADAPACRSTDPDLTLDGVFNGDTSTCTVTDRITWGDRTPPQQVTVAGHSASGVYPIARHTFGASATTTFKISLGIVSSAGPCTPFAATYTFTLIVSICSADNVAHGTGSRPPAPPGLEARSAATQPGYFYVAAYQDGAADGAQGRFRVADPVVANGECHSLAEMAVESADGEQIIEVGWIVDPAQFGGSTLPHLFVYHWVNGKQTCYDECGFVPMSHLAGMQLAVGSQPFFTIRYVPGRWEIWDDQTLVGFYPESLWEHTPGAFTHAGLTQWFGEVSAPPATTRPCSQMGTGQFPSATTPAGETGEISAMTLLGGPRVSYWILITSPSFYTAKRVPDTPYASTMEFGGPGAGNCPD